MKRIYLLVTLFVALAGNAMAQRNIDLKVRLDKPATGTSIKQEVNFDFDVVFINNGPDAIMAGDTIAYQPAGAGFVFLIPITANKVMGDSIKDPNKRQISFTKTQALGSVSICAIGIVGKGKSNTAINAEKPADTANNRSCKTVTVTAGSGGGGGGTSIFSVANNENVSQEGLVIAPNPATSEVTFNFVSGSDAEVNARVTDITGRVVYSHNYGKAFVGQTDYSMNIGDLNAGIYFVELNQDGHRAVGKVIKQ